MWWTSMWKSVGKAFKPVPLAFWIVILVLFLILASIWRETIFFAQVNAVTGYFAERVSSLEGWMIATIVIIAMVLSSPALKLLIERAASFEFQGLTLKLGEKSRDTLQGKFEQLTASIRSYRENLSGQIVKKVADNKLQSKLGSLNEAIKELLPGKVFPEGYRCTVHVRDPMFEDEFYQLLEYFTAKGNSEGDAGRTRPIGYGIIGRVWRSGLNDIRGELFPPGSSTLTDVQRISLEWGMSLEDAEKASRHRSYLCCLIQHQGEKVGILYADATEEHSFYASGASADQVKALLSSIVSKVENGGLARPLHDLETELAKVSPKIKIGER